MSKLEALMRDHLKKQQAARDAHDAKVKVVQGKLAQNIKLAQDATAERNKAADDFHKNTKLTGLAFIEALTKLHDAITEATEAKLVEVPDSSAYGSGLTETLIALDQAFDADRIKIEKEEADATALAAAVIEPPSQAEEAATSQANDAHESLFQALTKLGVKPEELATALGIESKAAREKRQKADREEQGRLRKEAPKKARAN